MDPDTLISLANDLKQAKERVAFLEDAIKAAVQGSAEPGCQLNALLSGIPSASMPERITFLFSSQPSTNFTIKHILDALGGNEGYVRSLLSRMVNDGRIESRGWGKYGAKIKIGAIKDDGLELDLPQPSVIPEKIPF
jgi:hypothetical protein